MGLGDIHQVKLQKSNLLVRISKATYETSYLWLYGIKAIMSDCLSEDRGSIPLRVAKKRDQLR